MTRKPKKIITEDGEEEIEELFEGLFGNENTKALMQGAMNFEMREKAKGSILLMISELLMLQGKDLERIKAMQGLLILLVLVNIIVSLVGLML